MVESNDKKKGVHKACINPACDYLHSADDEDDDVGDGGEMSNENEE
jgi:DNA topoisomerase-1